MTFNYKSFSPPSFYNKIGEENADRYKFRFFSCNSFIFSDVIFNLCFSVDRLEF